MSQIKFIFFDLGNVLLTFSHQRGAEQMAAVSGLPVKQVSDIVFEGPLQVDYETGNVSSEDFHRAFCEQTGAEPSLEEFLLAGSDIFEFNPQVAPIVTQLRAINFPIGILSNTCPAHWNFVNQNYPVLRHWFSLHVLSDVERSMKPDQKIYQAAIERAGVPANEIFFTDDRMENVEGAIKAGIDAVQFVNASQLLSDMHQRGIGINL